ncbi:MAG: phosphatidylglycerol lysyltransferase domain-containing protein [Bacteroidales bacterium]|nr:phosphatidylglycerol lysyltransferase domain-containing protein [Bacteroidales bacterium]MDD2425576.1 phosphatidylglycerol lysyltransferase domain-containing protein [Bacteroidales bacterium]MDD3989432.1 phosphatidylglycerol lysyltransferase domain-containing protein [Bacteroidales bacterium]MDD4638252.1 phosphatidylglycerol lysyltransferase domain-containing protein [Bacteroidales bacterium]
MIDFRKIELTDKEWIDTLLGYSDYRGAEYCFTNLFIWDGVYNSRIARYKDFLLLISGEGENTRYLYPAGRGDKKEAIERLKADAQKRDVKMVLIGLSPEAATELEHLYPGEFTIHPYRSSFDYIYEKEKLITLSGKKLQSKRNHINFFKSNYNWDFQEFTPENVEEIKDFNREWCREVDCSQSESLDLEICAVKKCLENYAHLGLTGGILRVDGKIVAYTVGEQINSDTFIVHIEKAFANVRGAYPVINNEFVKRMPAGIKYVNREDDAGDAGLRNAKESYNPLFMQEKHSAQIIDEQNFRR